ncbi:MAG TPA: hypothetical protein EYP86_00960 [Candidatus Altiarchaeales archaeon]|nr:hypothetical protein [Candidatus Altiarchaeales archaeon]
MIYVRNSFLRYNYKVDEADVCFIGIPFDSTTINSGGKYGSVAVREALKNIEGYDPVLGTDVFEELKISDLGDIEVVHGSYELTAERIRDTISHILEKNPDVFIISVGGEHLVTLPVIETLVPENVVVFDAHADMRKDYLGVKYSHATWAYHASKKFNMIHRGVRGFSKEERDSIHEIDASIRGKSYLTVDIDVFDPSIAPETGLQEVGGWKFDDFCKNLADIENMISADIVEVAPMSFNSVTANLAANVIKKILCRLVV